MDYTLTNDELVADKFPSRAHTFRYWLNMQTVDQSEEEKDALYGLRGLILLAEPYISNKGGMKRVVVNGSKTFDRARSHLAANMENSELKSVEFIFDMDRNEYSLRASQNGEKFKVRIKSPVSGTMSFTQDFTPDSPGVDLQIVLDKMEEIWAKDAGIDFVKLDPSLKEPPKGDLNTVPIDLDPFGNIANRSFLGVPGPYSKRNNS